MINQLQNIITLSSDSYVSNLSDEYILALKAPIIKPVIKVYLLYDDESIKEDITDYVVEGGNISISYQQGQRRTASISLRNDDGRWSSSKNTGGVWVGTKFRIDLGIEYGSHIFLKQMGIFTPGNIEINDEPANKTVDLQMVDKFALLDGTLGGKISETYAIPVEESVRDAIESLLIIGKDTNNFYDLKSLIFPIQYEDEKLAYTVTKEAGSNIGEIITELAEMISCDVYYNEFGNLILESGTDNLSPINKPILWSYSKGELELLSSGISRDYSEVVNKAIVIGANVNGAIFDAYSENTNLNSPSNVYNNPINFIRITDENIYSDMLAQDRADYELYKSSIKSLDINFSSTFIPHLDANKCFTYQFDKQLEPDKYLIKSINISLNQAFSTSIKATNIKEMPF